MVTLVLGLFVMVSLVSGDQLPNAGTTWYGALFLGATLGLLASNDLVARVK